jgi:hypothetical protein
LRSPLLTLTYMSPHTFVHQIFLKVRTVRYVRNLLCMYRYRYSVESFQQQVHVILWKSALLGKFTLKSSSHALLQTGILLILCRSFFWFLDVPWLYLTLTQKSTICGFFLLQITINRSMIFGQVLLSKTVSK